MAPVLEKQAAKTGFAVRALARLHKSETDVAKARELWTSLAASTVEHMRINILHSPEPQVKTPRLSYQPATPGPARHLVCPHHYLTSFVSALLDMDGDAIISDFCDKIVSGAPGISPRQIPLFWIPFLHGLAEMLLARKVPLPTSPFCKVFRAVLKANVDRYVGKEPVRPASLAQPPVACSCRDCG